METKIYSTCQRRGYELTDIHIWEVTKGREHLGYERFGEPCDPPQYIQTDPDEHERILPKGATVIEQRFDKMPKNVVYSTSNDEDDLSTRVAQIVEENKALRKRVRELENQPRSNVVDVELFDRWRLEYSWKGSAGDIVQEWGFHSSKSATERMERIQEMFKDFKFDDVRTVPYKTNES